MANELELFVNKREGIKQKSRGSNIIFLFDVWL